MGLIFMQIGNFSKAKTSFEKGLAINSNNAANHFTYAVILEKMGLIDEAMASTRKSIKITQA